MPAYATAVGAAGYVSSAFPRPYAERVAERYNSRTVYQAQSRAAPAMPSGYSQAEGTLHYHDFVPTQTRGLYLEPSLQRSDASTSVLGRVIDLEKKLESVTAIITQAEDIDMLHDTGKQLLYSLNQTFISLNDYFVKAKILSEAFDHRGERLHGAEHFAADVAALSKRIRLLEQQWQTDYQTIQQLQARIAVLEKSAELQKARPRQLESGRQAQRYKSYGDVFYNLESTDPEPTE